jgi:short-subunit dehydrogenase
MPSDIFKTKVVAITGGSEGIGKALVDAFIGRGAKVATCGRDADKLYNLRFQHSKDLLLTVIADVSNENDCKNFIDSAINTFGDIVVLINNAGIYMRALVADTQLTTLKKVMDTNFWGTVYCTKFALPSITKTKGVIVGVSSIAGYRGLPGRSGYSASKHAINGWLEALRTEVMNEGVHVMWVCPGFTTSNIRNAALNKDAKPQGESPLNEKKLVPSEQVAEHIIKAIEKRKRTLVLTFEGKQTVFMNKFFPAWTDKLVRKFFFKNDELIK